MDLYIDIGGGTQRLFRKLVLFTIRSFCDVWIRVWPTRNELRDAKEIVEGNPDNIITTTHTRRTDKIHEQYGAVYI